MASLRHGQREPPLVASKPEMNLPVSRATVSNPKHSGQKQTAQVCLPTQEGGPGNAANLSHRAAVTSLQVADFLESEEA
jgi:hypothetical protein